MPRFDDETVAAEGWAEECIEGTDADDAVNDENRVPSEGGEEAEDETDGADSGRAGVAFFSTSTLAVRFTVGEESTVGEDSGSGPATAERRSNGSSDGSEADGESGEALRGACAAVDDANRSFMSSSKRERKEEGAAAVSAGEDACQVDIDMESSGVTIGWRG